MRDAIQERSCHLGIAEDGDPFPELQTGRDNDTGLLVELADQMEQQRTRKFTGWEAYQRGEPATYLANLNAVYAYMVKGADSEADQATGGRPDYWQALRDLAKSRQERAPAGLVTAAATLPPLNSQLLERPIVWASRCNEAKPVHREGFLEVTMRARVEF